MNIQGPSSSGLSVGTQLQAAMFRKVRDVQEAQGQAAVKLIEQTGQTAAAQSGAHPSVGSLLDVYA